MGMGDTPSGLLKVAHWVAFLEGWGGYTSISSQPLVCDSLFILFF